MPSLPLDKPSHFSLDAAGVVSLLGGDDALSVMTAVHVYGNRRWLGWYNDPGSFQLARRLDSFAKSASFHNNSSRNFSLASLPTRGVHMDPAALLGLDNCKGPKFRAAHSGTIIKETCYLANLFMRECAAWDSEGKVVPGRRTEPIGITVADLNSAPAAEVRPARDSSFFTLLLANIPIITSVGACALSAAFGDWYSSLRIILGVVASGLFCFTLGSADFVFTHPEPAVESPPGNGILYSDKDIVLLRGTEGAVNSITHGNFSLHLSCEDHYNLIRLCSVLYVIQGITQLVLIPQASLFGQVMFLVSLAVSALYNAWLVPLNKEQGLGREFIEGVLGNPMLTKLTFGSRTTAVVFALLFLRFQDPTMLLDELLQEDDKVWRLWKMTILEWLRHPNDQSLQLGSILGDLNGFTQEEKAVLKLLYEDAVDAYNAHKEFIRVEALIP